MGAWMRCDSCRKVLAADQFTVGVTTCQGCLSAPAPRVRATAVKTVRSASSVPSEPRAERTGIVGSGDLEVRERRAKKAALEQLAEVHAEDYQSLLQAARRAEGLRA